MWNDAFIASQCEQVAARVERDVAAASSGVTVPSDQSLAAQIDLAVRLILCRHPTENENQELLEYARQHGMANLCRLLLNTNEFLFVN